MTKTATLPELIYSISQVNALTGVPKSTIRFWEKEFEEFLTPLRTTGNQRRYDPEAVKTIEQINKLVNAEGYTLEGARRKMRGSSQQQAAREDNSEAHLSELAETMSDFLLQKLFDRVRREEERYNHNLR